MTSPRNRIVLAAVATVLVGLSLAPGAGAATNSAPIAQPDSTQAWANHRTYSYLNELTNDTDADGDYLTAYLVTNPAHGQIDTFWQSGGFWYQPDPGFVGTDSFTYSAYDGKTWSQPATVTIEVLPNTAPHTSPRTYSVGSGKTLHGVSVLDWDYDEQQDPMTAVAATDPPHGTVTMQADGTFTYVSDSGYVGPDSFTYRASDGTSDSEPETANITVVEPENHAPTVPGYDFGIVENQWTACVPILYYAADVDADVLTLVIESAPQHGTLTLEDGMYTCYHPTFNYAGDDEFTYRVSDGTTTSELATSHVTVDPIFIPTVASEDMVVRAGTTITGNVLANDSDPNGDPLTATLSHSSQRAGTLVIAPDGSFTYTAPPAWAGIDQYRYTVSDGNSTPQYGYINFQVWSPAPGASASDLASAKSKSQGATLPFANIRVNRAVLRGGRLSVQAEISKLATGRVTATFAATGHASRVRAKIVAGAIRFTLRLSAQQRRSASGVLKLAYAGNAATRAEKVRLVAARRSSALNVKAAYVDAAGSLRVGGTIARSARGVVDVRLTYSPRAGKTKSYDYKAKIRAGSWALSDVLPTEAARAHGQVAISYAGDKPRGISGAHVSQGL